VLRPGAEDSLILDKKWARSRAAVSV